MRSRWWSQVADTVDFAFQPIVDARGACFGYEALLRSFEQLGFAGPFEVFDEAYADSALYALDIALRRRAVEKFVRIPHHRHVKLFYNLDNRLLDMPDYSAGNTHEIMAEHGLVPSAVCFEVSERHEMTSHDRLARLLTTYRRQGFQIALDDFGAGFSGLQLLYLCKPDHVKIDRFFVEGIGTDRAKRRFLRHVVQAVHSLGIPVIAEGVETDMELNTCRAMGCDLIQGFRVQRPQLEIEALRRDYADARMPAEARFAG